MTSEQGVLVRSIDFLIRLYEILIPASLIALLARFAMAFVFWKSGQTKISGPELLPKLGDISFKFPTAIKDSTYTLFQYEYNVPLLSAKAAAVLTTMAELILPIALLLGLGTRFSATALLIMTIVIQIFVYPSAYLTHALWAVSLLYIMAHGPGGLSLDLILRKRFMHG